MSQASQCKKCKVTLKTKKAFENHKCKKKDVDKANKDFVDKIKGISFGRVPGGTK